MSLPDPLKSNPDLTSRPGDRSADHEVDLLLNEIDERLAIHGAPAETNMAGLDMLAAPLEPAGEPARRRPDIQAAEALLHAANAEYGVAVARLYPQVDLSANLGSQALTAGLPLPLQPPTTRTPSATKPLRCP